MATCGDDVVPEMLAPYVARGPRKGGEGSWAVYANGLPQGVCWAHFSRKRDAEGAIRDRLSQWVRGALDKAERAGFVVIAPGPESACSLDLVNPWDNDLQGWPSTGLPIHSLGGPADLARFRLGWSAERWLAASSGRGPWSDAQKVAPSFADAATDLDAGRLSPEEKAALGATPATAPYLDLGEVERAALARVLWHDPRNRAGIEPATLPEQALCQPAPP